MIENYVTVTTNSVTLEIHQNNEFFYVVLFIATLFIFIIIVLLVL